MMLSGWGPERDGKKALEPEIVLCNGPHFSFWWELGKSIPLVNERTNERTRSHVLTRLIRQILIIPSVKIKYQKLAVGRTDPAQHAMETLGKQSSLSAVRAGQAINSSESGNFAENRALCPPQWFCDWKSCPGTKNWTLLLRMNKLWSNSPGSEEKRVPHSRLGVMTLLEDFFPLF